MKGKIKIAFIISLIIATILVASFVYFRIMDELDNSPDVTYGFASYFTFFPMILSIIIALLLYLFGRYGNGQ